MPRDVPVASREPVDAVEVARLEALRRLAMGAAHTLNNSFTTVVGEASFLADDRKRDAQVSETCTLILTEMERCTRITRALLARRHPSQGGQEEVDLVRLVRELGNLLAETLGRHHELEVSYPDDLLLVSGEAGALELLTLTLVHYAADSAGGPARLRLAVRAMDEGRGVEVSVETRSETLREEVVVALASPERASDPVTRAQLQAVAELAEAHGASRRAERHGPDRWVARVRFRGLA